MTVDVIIPVYKPSGEFFKVLDLLDRQSLRPDRIILMNTEEKYFEQLVYGTDFYDKHKNVKVYHLSQREFDHGGTRRRAVTKSQADVFVMMTQDAVPADTELLKNLTTGLAGDVAVSYARQLPRENSSVEEKLSRTFNYPEQSCKKSGEDLPKLGIKTFFCSNVCAAYRRDVYEKLGGFVPHTIFNEDMIYASGVIRAGYRIAYEASAMVYHSHDYTNAQQFHRNFDLGVSQAEFPKVFAGLPSEGEGKRYVREVSHYLRKNGMLSRIPHFYLQCVCKYAGYLLGKNYKKLPEKLVLSCTGNRQYWLRKG